MECEACKEKQAMIDLLLDRLQGVHVELPSEGESVMESLANQVDANDEERLAAEARNREAAREVNDKFRMVHLTSPYAHCKIIEADPANG